MPNVEPAEVTLAELVAAGEALGADLGPGEVVWLEGDLGAGKTTMVQAIATGLGVTEPATSPTYGLVHRYQGRRGPVFHVDCYRLKHPEEARDLDWDRLATGDAVLVEWPSRAGRWALPPTRRIQLEHAIDPTRRRLAIAAG
ncbi:MAG: tRNA (adenosine(37)-N6)-threonylcarbamoyltransferase complex ATPase subunit type 1 TsaE [Gemmatimonadales bacterium]